MTHRILILDDDIPVSDSLAIFLEDEDFEVAQASSAEDALDYLKRRRVDLVVVDLRLPGMDGQGFISAAKDRWPALKFIVYTGSPEFQIPTAMVQERNVSNAIFLKPLPEFEPLVHEIRRMLR